MTSIHSRKEWDSPRTRSEPPPEICPHCGSPNVRHAVSAWELAGGIVALLLLLAITVPLILGISRCVEQRLQNLSTRLSSPLSPGPY
jgi:hypothetical protein